MTLFDFIGIIFNWMPAPLPTIFTVFFDIDKKLRDLTDGMFLHVNVLNVFSVGKRIYKKIVLTDSTSEAESRISENLHFSSIFNWTVTYIPNYTQYYDSYCIPEKPSLSFRELAARDPEKQIRQNKIRLFKSKNNDTDMDESEE